MVAGNDGAEVGLDLLLRRGQFNFRIFGAGLCLQLRSPTTAIARGRSHHIRTLPLSTTLWLVGGERWVRDGLHLLACPARLLACKVRTTRSPGGLVSALYC